VKKSLLKISIFLTLPLLAAMLLATPAFAQSINIDMNEGSGLSSSVFRLILMITVLSLAPSILMMVTSFTRIIVVLSLLRSAIGIQQTPPNSVLISLGLFLTLFVMQPTFEASYKQGIDPYMKQQISEQEAMKKTSEPFHQFMLQHTNDAELNLFITLANEAEGQELKIEAKEDVPFRVLIPAFMISELKRAFEIGFLIFIPFLIIDMMVASTLMSMGMMMLPPVLISLPFKIIFFVLIDGWAMLSESLVKSFS
jgi:flagellar biosynthetic protein FliP